jgi:hypothetical protein
MNTNLQITSRRFFPRIAALWVMAFAFGGCTKSDSDGQLSPARNISGTWTTPSPVTFFMASDGCGAYARYNSTPVKMRWEITEIDDNTVDVWIHDTHIGATTQIGSNCGLPATLTFPLHFRGTVSSSNLKLEENQMQYSSTGAALGLSYVTVGNFNFTTDNLTGTITEQDCPIYCSGYETNASACIVTRD